MKSKSTFTCSDCEKIFYEKFDFIQHQNIHSGNAPFMCINCKETFNTTNQYIDHVKNKHYFLHSKKLNKNISNIFDYFKTIKEIDIENLSESGCDLEPQELCENLGNQTNSITCHKCFQVQKTLKDFFFHISKDSIKNILNYSYEEECKCCTCVLMINPQNNLKEINCATCSKHFQHKDDFAKHSCSFSHIEENFHCSCSQTFSKISEFKSHVGKKPFECCGCSMLFNTITNLIRHIRTHTKQKPYICKECGRGFSQSAHLRNHSSVHIGAKAIKCDYCSFSCKTFNGLIKHKKKHKEDSLNYSVYVDGRKKSSNVSSCLVCGKQFLFKRNLAMHMKIHTNEVSLCNDCGKVFDSKGKLTSHYKACHREPSFCKTCGKDFASAVLLSAHEKTHVSDKTFPCEICNKTFSIKNYLVQHMKTHSNKKQFSCSKCGKLFKVAVSLKYHSNICTSLTIKV